MRESAYESYAYKVNNAKYVEVFFEPWDNRSYYISSNKVMLVQGFNERTFPELSVLAAEFREALQPVEWRGVEEPIDSAIGILFLGEHRAQMETTEYQLFPKRRVISGRLEIRTKGDARSVFMEIVKRIEEQGGRPK